MNKSEYKTRLEWKKANPSDYQLAINYGYLDDICDYYGWDKYKRPKIKPPGYWTRERCIEDAKRFKTRSIWSKESYGGYNSAK